MIGRRAVVLAAVLLLASATAPAGVAGAADGADDTIDRTVTLSLTPDDPGAVAVRVGYDVPDRVTSLDVSLPERASVTDATGFERAGTRTYNWTGDTATPGIEFTVQVNESSSGGRSPGAVGSHGGTGTDFVDVGPWALFRVPQAPSSWAWTGETAVDVDTRYRTEPGGYVGTWMAYLGPHEVHRRTAGGQTFSLVVPAAADMTPSVDAVLSSLAAASRSLRVGDRDARVNLFVAPTSADWAGGGLQLGDTDAWVRADASMSAVRNTWLHEYVHTRQAFDAATEMRWVTEASAEYYAALLALQQGHVGYQAFRDALAAGTNPVFDESVLSRPGTWVAGTQYFKGALVVGAVDRRLRLASDGSATFQDVFAGLNALEDPVSGPEYEALVRRHGGDDVAAAATRWTTTTATPATWSASEHDAAFGTTPPTFDVRLDGATYRVSGPYRDRSTAVVPTVFAGETLRLDVPVENTGDRGGSGTVELVRNDTVVDAADVELASGASTTVALAAAFDEPGTYSLLVGTERVAVTVRSPAAPAVASLSANRSSVAPGESVGLSATVRAPDDRPADGTVAVRVDGAVRTETAVVLGPGETTEISAAVTLDEPGDHTVAVGNRSVTVTVADAGVGFGGATPGVGPVGTLVAALLAAALAGWRGS